MTVMAVRNSRVFSRSDRISDVEKHCRLNLVNCLPITLLSQAVSYGEIMRCTFRDIPMLVMVAVEMCVSAVYQALSVWQLIREYCDRSST